MSQPSQESAVRLDKWLWAARFYKTRAIARTMIEGGKVHYNGVRGKPSKMLKLGLKYAYDKVMMNGQLQS